MEESIPEEPHRIFFLATEINSELFDEDEELPDNQLSDEGSPSYVDVSVKKERQNDDFLSMAQQSYSSPSNALCEAESLPLHEVVLKNAFCKSSGLRKHNLSHSGVKTYQCDVCNKIYRHSHGLSVHKLNHCYSKKHICDICNKAYTQLRHLTEHKLFHSHIRNHKCDVCSLEFVRACDLKKHTTIHSKKYQCDVCSKGFSQSGMFEKHRVRHCTFKKYQWRYVDM